MEHRYSADPQPIEPSSAPFYIGMMTLFVILLLCAIAWFQFSQPAPKPQTIMIHVTTTKGEVDIPLGEAFGMLSNQITTEHLEMLKILQGGVTTTGMMDSR